MWIFYCTTASSDQGYEYYADWGLSVRELREVQAPAPAVRRYNWCRKKMDVGWLVGWLGVCSSAEERVVCPVEFHLQKDDGHQRTPGPRTPPGLKCGWMRCGSVTALKTNSVFYLFKLSSLLLLLLAHSCTQGNNASSEVIIKPFVRLQFPPPPHATLTAIMTRCKTWKENKESWGAICTDRIPGRLVLETPSEKRIKKMLRRLLHDIREKKGCKVQMGEAGVRSRLPRAGK